MQSIAFELGIAETAYLTPSDDPSTFGLRWFSPAVEIDLCGHATLASAHALREGGAVDGTEPLTFHTRSGPLRAAFAEDRIELDFPADQMAPGPLPAALAEQWPGAVVDQRRDRLLHLRGPLVGRGRPRLSARPPRHRLHGRQGAAADRRRGAGFGRRLRAARVRAECGDRRGSRHRVSAVLGRARTGRPYWDARSSWPTSSPGGGPRSTSARTGNGCTSGATQRRC